MPKAALDSNTHCSHPSSDGASGGGRWLALPLPPLGAAAAAAAAGDAPRGGLRPAAMASAMRRSTAARLCSSSASSGIASSASSSRRCSSAKATMSTRGAAAAAAACCSGWRGCVERGGVCAAAIATAAASIDSGGCVRVSSLSPPLPLPVAAADAPVSSASSCASCCSQNASVRRGAVPKLPVVAGERLGLGCLVDNADRWVWRWSLPPAASACSRARRCSARDHSRLGEGASRSSREVTRAPSGWAWACVLIV
jgi:hypothetical protein